MTPPPEHAREDSEDLEDLDGELPTVRGSMPPAREWGRTYVIGLFMGTADAVPGVSGGTIALIAGIYERLITAVTAVTPSAVLGFLGAFLPIDGGVSVRRAAKVFEDVDGWFLVALLAGIATAVIAVTGVVDWADEEVPRLLLGFFFGLIAASAVILLRAISVRRTDEIVAAIAGFLIAFLVSGLELPVGQSGLAFVFLAGAIAVSAMILPGVSGSLFLVILGMHAYMSETLHAFIDAIQTAIGGGGTADLVTHGTVVGTFIVGGLLGVLTVARLIRRALDINRGATLAFLVALVVGALRAPIERIGQKGFAWTGETLFLFGVAALVGAVLVLVLDWYAVDIDLDAA